MNKEQIAKDKALIKSHGGASRVAEMLHLDKKSGPQRVHNWMTRGIPPRVKLENPSIFLNGHTDPTRQSIAQESAQ